MELRNKSANRKTLLNGYWGVLFFFFSSSFFFFSFSIASLPFLLFFRVDYRYFIWRVIVICFGIRIIISGLAQYGRVVVMSVCDVVMFGMTCYSIGVSNYHI